MDLLHPIDRLTGELIGERLRLGGCQGPARAEVEGAERMPAQRAAVLLPLFRPGPENGADGGWRLLFIRRAAHAQDPHSAQVGFPGGRWEPTDASCTETALREAQEEIGLDPGQVRLLGEMSPLYTATQFRVTPVVGTFSWPQPLAPDPREVARIFSIPLAWLCEPDRHCIRPYPAPDHPSARDLIFFDEYDGELLWGVSARIVLDLLRCLARER